MTPNESPKRLRECEAAEPAQSIHPPAFTVGRAQRIGELPPTLVPRAEHRGEEPCSEDIVGDENVPEPIFSVSCDGGEITGTVVPDPIDQRVDLRTRAFSVDAFYRHICRQFDRRRGLAIEKHAHVVETPRPWDLEQFLDELVDPEGALEQIDEESADRCRGRP